MPIRSFCAGPNEAKPARTFICGLFKNLNKVKSREIYHHFTTAVDKSNVQFVFDAVADVVADVDTAVSDVAAVPDALSGAP